MATSWTSSPLHTFTYWIFDGKCLSTNFRKKNTPFETPQRCFHFRGQQLHTGSLTLLSEQQVLALYVAWCQWSEGREHITGTLGSSGFTDGDSRQTLLAFKEKMAMIPGGLGHPLGEPCPNHVYRIWRLLWITCARPITRHSQSCFVDMPTGVEQDTSKVVTTII